MAASAAWRMALYRARMRAEGYRLAEYWVLDLRRRDVRDRVARQCRALRSSPAEPESLDSGDLAASQIEGWA